MYDTGDHFDALAAAWDARLDTRDEAMLRPPGQITSFTVRPLHSHANLCSLSASTIMSRPVRLAKRRSHYGPETTFPDGAPVTDFDFTLQQLNMETYSALDIASVDALLSSVFFDGDELVLETVCSHSATAEEIADIRGRLLRRGLVNLNDPSWQQCCDIERELSGEWPRLFPHNNEAITRQ